MGQGDRFIVPVILMKDNMNHKLMKFENPIRLEELRPEETLRKVGLQKDHVLCDIGAGSGIFTVPAAKITKQIVYALEINEEMLSIIGDKAKTEGIENIRLIQVSDGHFAIEDNTADIALMVTVLHEIEDTKLFINEVKRVLKKDGKIAVIEFHKRETPMGPPTGHRIDKDKVRDIMLEIGFIVCEDYDMGKNFYCMVFKRKEL
jgi:ubiquinone/menaquinone biosynthesis C-methylase UbiE